MKIKALKLIDEIRSLQNIIDFKIDNKDLIITGFSPISEPNSNTICWVKNSLKIEPTKYTNNLIILEKDHKSKEGLPNYVEVDNPRLIFAKLMNLFMLKKYTSGIHPSAIIDNNAKIGRNVAIGPNCFIDKNVSIGDDTTIMQGVSISSNVNIGSDCFIKSNTVIGEDGFGVETDLDGKLIDIPHIGGVVIKNNVRIGALNTVVAGTISPTIIDDYVKTDDHVHIAHNVKIGKSTKITASVMIAGSVTIGEKVWIGPNASIIDNISIGSKSFIGLGAVVTKSVTNNVLVAGNPARVLKKI